MQIYKNYNIPSTYKEISDMNQKFNPPGIELEKVQYIDYRWMTHTISTISYKRFKTAKEEDRPAVIQDYIDKVHEYIDTVA